MEYGSHLSIIQKLHEYQFHQVGWAWQHSLLVSQRGTTRTTLQYLRWEKDIKELLKISWYYQVPLHTSISHVSTLIACSKYDAND